MRIILPLIAALCALAVVSRLALADSAPYPNKLQLSGSAVGGVDATANQLIGRNGSADLAGLDPDEVADVLASDVDATGAKLPVLITISVSSNTAGTYTLTPTVAMTLTDVWVVQTQAGVATGDRIRVSAGSASSWLTDSLAWSETTASVARATSLTNTVATVSAGSPIYVVTTGAGTVAKGIAYLLGYRQ